MLSLCQQSRRVAGLWENDRDEKEVDHEPKLSASQGNLEYARFQSY